MSVCALLLRFIWVKGIGRMRNPWHKVRGEGLPRERPKLSTRINGHVVRILRIWRKIRRRDEYWRFWFQPKGVVPIYRIVSYIRVEVRIAATKTQRVLTNESLVTRAVVSCSVVIKAGGVVFTTGKLIDTSVGLTRNGRGPERLIRVASLNRSRAIHQSLRAPKNVR